MSIQPGYIFNRAKFEGAKIVSRNEITIEGKTYDLCYFDPYEGIVGVMINGERVEMRPTDATFNLFTLSNMFCQYIDTQIHVEEKRKLRVIESVKEAFEKFGETKV